MPCVFRRRRAGTSGCQSDTAGRALVREFDGFLKRLFGPAADEIGALLRDIAVFYRYKNRLRLGDKIEALHLQRRLEGKRGRDKAPRRPPFFDIAVRQAGEDVRARPSDLVANAASPALDLSVRRSEVRILVVEDEQVVAMDLADTVEHEVHGAAVALAADADEAITLAGELRPDVVLMDVRLRHGMDGIEAARIIRERYAIPVVFCTGYADPSAFARMRKVGNCPVLAKPVADNALREALGRAIRH
jgi:CheY-like chemotaxis protein